MKKHQMKKFWYTMAKIIQRKTTKYPYEFLLSFWQCVKLG